MSDLTPKLLELVARLAGQAALAQVTAPASSIEAQYRQSLRRWWTLTAQGPAADLAEVRPIYQEILRLIDEVGEPRATRLRWQWAREWYQQTGLCPFCGERGPYHDSERGGEPDDRPRQRDGAIP